MSIKEFEATLRSKLLHDIKSHGESCVMVAQNEWWLALSTEEYDRFSDICIDVGSITISKVEDILELEEIICRNKLDVDVSYRSGWYAPLKKEGMAFVTVNEFWVD